MLYKFIWHLNGWSSFIPLKWPRPLGCTQSSHPNDAQKLCRLIQATLHPWCWVFATSCGVSAMEICYWTGVAAELWTMPVDSNACWSPTRPLGTGLGMGEEWIMLIFVQPFSPLVFGCWSPEWPRTIFFSRVKRGFSRWWFVQLISCRDERHNSFTHIHNFDTQLCHTQLFTYNF